MKQVFTGLQPALRLWKKDCWIRPLNKEDTMNCSNWRKSIEYMGCAGQRAAKRIVCMQCMCQMHFLLSHW